MDGLEAGLSQIGSIHLISAHLVPEHVLPWDNTVVEKWVVIVIL